MSRLSLVLVLGLVAVLPATLAAQEAAVEGSSSPVLIVDPSSASPVVSTFAFPTSQSTRGLTWGHDGALYVSWWTSNALGRLDLSTGLWTTIAPDPSNAVTGAPYQPVVNNEAVGGPGFWVVDGNPPPSPATGRNTALIDINNNSSAVDAIFATTFTPMSDGFANPLKPGEFLGVGFSTSDYQVSQFTIQGSPTSIVPGVLTSLAQPCQYDALIHEDGKLYTWSGSSSFMGFMCVDVVSGAQTSLPVNGITYATSGYAAVWNDPWEKPGRLAYVAYDGDDTLYIVDLTTNPAVVIGKKALPVGTYNNGREREESQLSSWTRVKSKTERILHLNFGPSQGGNFYAVVPSVSGLAKKPLVLNGQEIFLNVDNITVAGLLGWLGYSPIGSLDRSGTASVVFDLKVPLKNLPAWWQAIAFDKSGVTDVSNVIGVLMP